MGLQIQSPNLLPQPNGHHHCKVDAHGIYCREKPCFSLNIMGKRPTSVLGPVVQIFHHVTGEIYKQMHGCADCSAI